MVVLLLPLLMLLLLLVLLLLLLLSRAIFLYYPEYSKMHPITTHHDLLYNY